MSNSMEDTSMTPKAQRTLTPKLRFPEFRDAGEWGTKELSELAVIINEKAGCNKYTLMSISSGIGLVTQLEKFGREIAGEQYKNYIVIRKNDFAYNKSATRDYSEGFIAIYSGETPAAVPNSIFTCFRVDECKVLPEYLSYLFFCNLHGRWLKKFITVGARAHGSLNIYNDDLLTLPVPLPIGQSSLTEQQKIADCLCSIDELINWQARKIDALKAHKKGLMQQLFPAEGEPLPKLRFPEFRDAGEWVRKTLRNIAEIRSGSTPLRANADFYNGGHIPWVKTADLNNSYIVSTEEFITSKAKAKINPEGAVLVAMYGGFNQIGRTGYLKIPAATNQAISVLEADREIILPIYLLMWLNAKVELWKRIASSSRKDPNVTGADVTNFPVAYPCIGEQQKIADCLSSIDDLIALQTQKLDALKVHKKGLMQQLFPSLGDARE